jgi:S-adenosylmethionine:tRNA ribosyltransferase-isomerase
MFHLSDYTYDLPAEKIAQMPCKSRSESRLLHIQRASDTLDHHRFKDISDLLRKDDLLVINNTRVIPARLLGQKASGGKIEVLIIDYAAGMNHLEQTGFFQCDCLLKASRKPKKGSLILFAEGVEAEVVEDKGSLSVVRFFCPKGFPYFLQSCGEIPLPPYIKREDKALAVMDKTSYQTVYAAEDGAVAAPTAGLHFTEDLMAELNHKGVEFVPLTLHVGYGTFVPVKTEDIRDHQIHSEYFSVPQETADRINAARRNNRRIVAVGTTSVRVLEFISGDEGRVKAGTGMCNLFIYPGYRFKCTDALITNFHLPESSLLMLVSAFYDREKILAAYKEAVQRDYRFFSYGDAMLIE